MSVWNVGGEDLSLECVGDGGLGLDFGGVWAVDVDSVGSFAVGNGTVVSEPVDAVSLGDVKAGVHLGGVWAAVVGGVGLFAVGNGTVFSEPVAAVCVGDVCPPICGQVGVLLHIL